jgi:hypothetical protein
MGEDDYAARIRWPAQESGEVERRNENVLRLLHPILTHEG